jgi:hypothetical protein
MNIEKMKRRWQREDEDRINSAVSAAISSREGRKFLWWLLEIGRVGTQPFTTNALNTAFGCGELNVGQRILDRIVSNFPEGYLTMMKENNDEVNERNQRLELAADGIGEEDGEAAPLT